MNIHRAHSVFENEVRMYFEAQDFLTDEATYHEVMDENVKNRLASIYEPTSLYIRGRADRVSVHKSLPIACQWEAKTHDTYGKHDMVLELMPFLHHLTAGELGVRCLYAYRDKGINLEVGFWMDSIPRIRTIFLTTRLTGELDALITPAIRKYMPNAQVKRNFVARGSNDPFLIIDEQDVRRLQDWRELVNSLESPPPVVVIPDRIPRTAQASFF